MEAIGRSVSNNLYRIVKKASSPVVSQNARALCSVSEPKSRGRTELDHDELSFLMEFEDISLIDVRTPNELRQYGGIPGAINIPLSQVKAALQLPEELWLATFHLHKPGKNDQNIIFYARGPNASSAAVEIAHKLGFKKSRQYIGGWEDYCQKMGVPLKKQNVSN